MTTAAPSRREPRSGRTPDAAATSGDQRGLTGEGLLVAASFESTARSADRKRDGFLVGEPRTARLLEVVPLGEDRLVGLSELLGRRTDAIGDRRELLEVEVVERRRVEPEDLRGLVLGHVPEAILQELAGVGPRAFRVGKVVAPHDVADADLVAASELAASRVRRADAAVPVEVLARQHLHDAVRVGHLAGAVIADRHHVESPEHVGRPEAARLRDRHAQPRETFEHAGEQHEPQRSRGEEDRLVAVDAHPARHFAVVLVCAGTRVAVHGKVEILRDGPHRVVAVARVGRVVAPLRRDDDAAPQSVGVGALDLRDRAVEVAEDRSHDQAGTPLRALRAELGRPAVVRTSAREEVLGVSRGDGVESRSERSAHRAGRGVGTGEHDLRGDAVVVELVVTLRGVPRTTHPDLVEAVALVVLPEPLLLELVVAHERRHPGRLAALVDQRLALGELELELVVVLRVEEVLVDRRVRAGVTVCRDDHVVLHGLPLG